MPTGISMMATGLKELNMDKVLITSKMDPSTMASGSLMIKMASEPLLIPTVINTRESGETGRKAEEESIITPMEMSMREIGKTIRETVLVCWCWPTGISTTVNGSKGRRMEEALMNFLMGTTMKGIGTEGKDMEREDICGGMGRAIMETGETIK